MDEGMRWSRDGVMGGALTAVALAGLIAACGGSGGTMAQVQAGGELFGQNCAGCHGAEAEGVPGSGRDLRDNTFIRAKSDEELVTFLRTGREEGHPENLTGREMPPEGGNPELTDRELTAVVHYLRSLQPGG